MGVALPAELIQCIGVAVPVPAAILQLGGDILGNGKTAGKAPKNVGGSACGIQIDKNARIGDEN